MDETIVGGVEPGGGRRHLGKKALVVIAAEVRGRAIGRIRMQRVADASADSLVTFVQPAVEPGAVVITDGLQSYRGLAQRGYRHDRRVVLGSRETADPVLPRIHRVASLLKRWLLGTHQGGVSREHLDYYLDEFTFRFNRRTSRHRGKLFYRLLEQAVAVGPVPYAAMVKGIPTLGYVLDSSSPNREWFSEWRTTLARSGSSTRASRPSTRAASTWRGSAGGRSSCAPPATGPRRGPPREGCGCARPVDIRRR